MKAAETVDVSGLLVTPGFWDMHSHGNLSSEFGRQAIHKLYQGITTIITGVDGGGNHDMGDLYARYERQGIAVFNLEEIVDLATYGDPHRQSKGTVHVIVNGRFAFRDGSPTGELHGRPLRRGLR